MLDTIFKYIQFVRRKALDKKLYNYVKSAYDLSFYFMNKKKAAAKMMKIFCQTVWAYDKKYYFTQHKILTPYNAKSVKAFGERLVLKNAVILIGDKEYSSEKLSKYSKFVNGFPVSGVNKGNKLDKVKNDKENVKSNNTEEILSKKDPFYFTMYNEFKLKKIFVNKVDSTDSAVVSGKNKGKLALRKEQKLFAIRKKIPKVISLIKMCGKSKAKVINNK